jgi:hypothetical protein
VLIDALGVHELSLREIDEAHRRLRERLPSGDPERDSADPDQVLVSAERSALVTVTQYSASGSTETAELSADIVLARQDDRLYVFTRDPEGPERLVSQGLDEGEVLELIGSLAGPGAHSGDLHSNAEPAPTGRIAKIRATIMRRLRRGERPPANSAQSAATQ